MQTLTKKTFLKPLPQGATIKTKRGKRVCEWHGKNGKLRTAPVAEKPDGTLAIRLQRKTWLARYRDSRGIVVERSTGCTDKAAARVKLAEFVRDEERISAGVMSRLEFELADWQQSLLINSIDDYSDYQTRRGNHAGRVKFTKAYLIQGAESCGWKKLADLSSDRLQRYLDDLQDKNAGAGALNQRIATWMAFGNWLAGKRIKGKRSNWNGEKRLAKNPFDGFGRYDDKADCRRKRRALTEEELANLLKVAAERPLRDAQTIRSGPNKGELGAKVNPKRIPELVQLGRERALIYKTLILTGLRKGELASLKVSQCQLDGDRPFLDLNANDEKNSQGNDIPLRLDLAEELREWIERRRNQPADVLSFQRQTEPNPDEPLFNVPSGLLRILNRDLKAAGIPKVDERGYSVDVHALRHSFGTLLSTSGVAPRVAQAAMRHSDLRLTMNVYTDPKLLDIHGALNKLPSLTPAPETKDQLATGTAGLVPPTVPHESCPQGSLADHSGAIEDSAGQVEKRKKPRENRVSRSFYQSG